MEPTQSRLRVSADKVINLAAGVFEKAGMSREDALDAAHVLVRADLRGVESHGIDRLSGYIDSLRSGRLNPRPDITVVRESPVSALIDGDGGAGLVVGVRAMDMCISKALELGMCIVAVRRSAHFGMASYFALRCLPHDLIGVSLTNNYGTGIVPTYGTQPMLSTNPISIVAPAGQEPPFELDFATSVVAMNKIGLRLSNGESHIPEGWALDEEGHPTQDAQRAWDGRRLLPLGTTRETGSHKGYGLAMAVDILTGVLAGGMYGNLVQRHPPVDPKQRFSSCHFFAAVRIDLFRPVDEFKASMDDMMRAVKDSPKAEGHDRIYAAGEIEYETELDRLRHGIPYHPRVITMLRGFAAELGLADDLA